MLDWLDNTWDKFESWFIQIWPGFHTKIVAFAGIIYSVSVALQEYVQGLPLENFITPTRIAIINIVLFSLIFWLRNVNNRVIARELKVTSKKIKHRNPVKAEKLVEAGELIRNDKILEAAQVVKVDAMVSASKAAKTEVEGN